MFKCIKGRKSNTGTSLLKNKNYELKDRYFLDGYFSGMYS